MDQSTSGVEKTDGDTADEKRPQFGSRYLTNPDKVFEHNAWDNVEWDQDQQEAADRIVNANSAAFLDKESAEKLECEASSHWDNFYQDHRDGFFKDRHWLFTEFPELVQQSQQQQSCVSADVVDGDQSTNHEPASFPGSGARRSILEVGCGVGNTVFPLLEQVNDPSLFVYCCDFSSNAIELVKSHASYDPNRCHAFVSDITEDPLLRMPFPEGSIDIITMIFVLSAIDPAKMAKTIANVARYLKSGGLLLLRDYGRYDMAQLRFKKGRCISDNFYVRGDKTRVYFFTSEELDDILCQAGLIKEMNYVDRRLQVNRGKLLKMYRVWIQCKYRKP